MEMLDRVIFDRWREHAKDEGEADICIGIAERSERNAESMAQTARVFHERLCLAEQAMAVCKDQIEAVRTGEPFEEALDAMAKAIDSFDRGQWITIPGQRPV